MHSSELLCTTLLFLRTEHVRSYPSKPPTQIDRSETGSIHHGVSGVYAKLCCCPCGLLPNAAILLGAGPPISPEYHSAISHLLSRLNKWQRRCQSLTYEVTTKKELMAVVVQIMAKADGEKEKAMVDHGTSAYLRARGGISDLAPCFFGLCVRSVRPMVNVVSVSSKFSSKYAFCIDALLPIPEIKHISYAHSQ
jgi:hypothetical protein